MQDIMKYVTTPVIIAFIGALLSALGAIWAAVKQEEESEQNKNLQILLTKKTQEIASKSDQYASRIDQYATKQASNDDKIKALQQDLINKQLELAEKADVQKKKTEEIARLSLKLNESQEKANLSQEKIAELNERIANYAIGGNSHCYAFLSRVSDHELKIRLYHRGKYPLSALRIHIVRSSDILKKANGDPFMIKSLRRENNFTYVFPVGPLPTSSEPFEVGGSIPYDPQIDDDYEIKFIAQNGTWRQHIRTNKGIIQNTGEVRRWDYSAMPDPYK